MKATTKKLTEQEIRDHRQNEYNYREWQRAVDRISKYSDVEFYVSEKGMEGAYDYDRTWVVYTLPKGTRYLIPFGYSSMLSNGGTGEAIIKEHAGLYYIETGAVQLATGKRVYIDGSTDVGKAYLNHRSTTEGTIWTKE